MASKSQRLYCTIITRHGNFVEECDEYGHAEENSLRVTKRSLDDYDEKGINNRSY